VSYENVDLYVKDTTPQANPVPGVVVKVMSQDGKVLYALSTTDSNGYLALLLPSAFSPFQARFYKFGWSFTNPLYLNVIAGASNFFDIPGSTLAPPVPSDPRLCTAYGYFRDITGRPHAGVRAYLIGKFAPVLLDGAAIVSERREIVSDDKGYAQIDLIRFGMYDLTIGGSENYARRITVPDRPNVNIGDLFFPIVAAATFSPSIPAVMRLGDPDLVVTPTVYDSAGNELPNNGASDVQWSSSDTNVLAVLPAGGLLTLRPLSTGTAQVIATRGDQSIIKIPDPGIQGLPATVVVQ